MKREIEINGIKFEVDMSKIEKNKVVESLNREIETKKSKIRDLENKKNWFVKYYEKHFENSELREDSDDE